MLRGDSKVRYRGDQIVEIVDSFEPSVEGEFAAWQQANGVPLNPSYV